MTSQRLKLTIRDRAASMLLCRPGAANAIDLVFTKEMEIATQSCIKEKVRSVLISAEGHHFCAGGDLKAFAKQPDLAAYLIEVTNHFHAAIALLVEMDTPLVTAVQGTVAGAGMGLVLAADIVVAGKSATFTMAYTGVGLTPDGSTSWSLPRHVGLKRATDLTLTNRVLSVDEAYDLNLISRVVEDDQVLPLAQEIATSLAIGPTKAFGSAAKLLRSAMGSTLRSHMDLESTILAKRARGVDAHEGIRAFIDHRSPNFTGD